MSTTYRRKNIVLIYQHTFLLFKNYYRPANVQDIVSSSLLEESVYVMTFPLPHCLVIVHCISNNCIYKLFVYTCICKKENARIIHLTQYFMKKLRYFTNLILLFWNSIQKALSRQNQQSTKLCTHLSIQFSLIDNRPANMQEQLIHQCQENLFMSCFPPPTLYRFSTMYDNKVAQQYSILFNTRSRLYTYIYVRVRTL